MSNELIDLILFHGKHLGLFSFKLGELRNRYMGVDFQSPAWLPLYEIERRGWDSSEAFSKLGSADDLDGLYDHLRKNEVEFYLTDDKFFSVEAFENWNLTQNDFDGDARDQMHHDDFYDFQYDTEREWENYE